MFRYHVYGLNIESELEIPELRQAFGGPPDVKIRLSDIEEQLPHCARPAYWFQAEGKRCLITAKGVGRYLVSNGKEIMIDRRVDRQRSKGVGAPESDLRLYLLGSAFGALLHQRGDLPLHVSAVDSGSGAWAFTGPSGAGKSTTAAWFHREKGWPLISDDVSAVRPGESRAMLYPGPRQLKLWEDAIERLGYQDADLKRDLSNTEKFQLFLKESSAVEAPPLRTLIVLGRSKGDQAPSLERLTGLDAFKACRHAVYRPIFERSFRQRGEFIADVTQLANKIEVYRFRRSWALNALPEQLAFLEDAIGRKKWSEAV